MTRRKDAVSQSGLKDAIALAVTAERNRIEQLDPSDLDRVQGAAQEPPVGYYDPTSGGANPN